MNQNNIQSKFCFHPSFIVNIVIGIVFFGVGFIVALLLPLFYSKALVIWQFWLFIVIGYLVVFLLFFFAWKHRNDYITIDDDAIHLYLKSDRIISLKWHEIIAVKEHNFLKRLTLRDKNNNLLKIEYQIENLKSLLNIIINNISHLTQRYLNIAEFHRAKRIHLSLGFCFIITSLIAAYFWFSHALAPTFVFCCFSFFLFFIFLNEFVSVKILSDEIIIVYPLWKRKIDISQIIGFKLEISPSGNVLSLPRIVIRLSSDEGIKLTSLVEGTIALYSALSSKLLEIHGK